MNRLNPSVILAASKDINILSTELIDRVKLESNLVWTLQGVEIYRLKYPSDNVKYFLTIDPSHILSLFTYKIHDNRSIIKLLLANKVIASQIHTKLGISNSIINLVDFEVNKTKSMDIHPGKILEEYLNRVGYTHQYFSITSSISVTSIRNLINGQQNLTQNMARRLGANTDIPYFKWLELAVSFNEAKQTELKIQMMGEVV